MEYGRTRDRELRKVLIEEHMWLAIHCARRFRRKGELSEDLDQVAMVGLIKALDRFDPTMGFMFSTFAVPTIIGELRRHFRDHTWAMRVPRTTQENYLDVKSAADVLHQALGRSPTIPELAEHAGLSIEDTIEALAANHAYRGIPLDAPDDDPGERDTAAELGSEDRGYALCEARMVIPGLVAALPTDRERTIIRLRFVDNMSQSQIAARLGLSQVHISRILRHSLQLMRRRLSA